MPVGFRSLWAVAALAAVASISTTAARAWEPTRTVEFLVPAGTGGGADQMARLIQGIIQKNGLMEQSMVVVNRSGGAGAEAFLDMQTTRRNPHKIVITLSSLFTTPLATGIPFSWEELTPVSLLALDQFVLWVNAKSPHQNAADYVAALKAAPEGGMKMGGTGSKQEDQIITAAIEQATGAKLTYVPYKGGGDVAAQLVGGHVDSSVNNPIEAVSQWRAGELRPLCTFAAQKMNYPDKIAGEKGWADLATCKEAGLPIEYEMMRGIFTVPGATEDQVAYYVDLFQRVRDTQDWKDFLARGAFNDTYKTGEDFKTWLASAQDLHQGLMEKAGFVAN